MIKNRKRNRFVARCWTQRPQSAQLFASCYIDEALKAMAPNRSDLPPAFETQMRSMLSDEYPEFRTSLDDPPAVSIRLNQRKVSAYSAEARVPWSDAGRYLDHRPVFTLDPHFHAGAYYVQEPSSMFIEQALVNSMDVSRPLRVLDLCGAPGGKSTHLLSLISSESFLVSNEAIRSRATVLSENIQKWGHANVMVTNNDPSAFTPLAGTFDVILIDAPCSGEGLFRKDRSAIAEWSPDNIALCSARQRRIILDAWPSLKAGGILIYCTCTYNEVENEQNLRWLASNRALEFISIKNRNDGIEEVISDGLISYRFFPHKLNGEGFCLSVIRKLEPLTNEWRPKSRRGQPRKSILSDWLKGDFVMTQSRELSIAVPAPVFNDIESLSQHLNTLLRGTALGTDKHGKIVPEHAAALSIHLDHSKFPCLDLTRDQAITYLRKETMSLDHQLDRGYCLARFEGNALGWMNVLDKRINNLYPASWRIRMQ